jgi:hypothetical protein
MGVFAYPEHDEFDETSIHSRMNRLELVFGAEERETMSRQTVANLPGRKDIDGQFKRANIQKTLRDFKDIFKNGSYEFGMLTAKYNGWAPDSPEYKNWIDGSGKYPEYAKTTIKNIIIEAMTGKDGPAEVSITWTASAQKAVQVSYDPVIPLYTIEIIGLPSPPATSIGSRKKKYSK